MLPASVPVDLTWNAPAECPTRDAVADEVAKVLAASKESRVRVVADVDVSRDEQGRWHAALRVVTGDARGERMLDAESCPAIASATAVIVAVAVEGGVPEPAPREMSSLPKPVSTATPPAQPLGSQLIVGAASVLDGAMLPSLAPGIEGAIGWAYSWSVWRIRGTATGNFFPPQESQPLLNNSEAPGEHGSFQLFAAAARLCGSVVQGAFDLGPCLGLEVDVMTGTGSAPARSTRNTGEWASALGSLLASWNLFRHFAIFLRGEGFVTLKPPWFAVVRSSPLHYIDVYRPSPIGARGALGVEVRFF